MAEDKNSGKDKETSAVDLGLSSLLQGISEKEVPKAEPEISTLADVLRTSLETSGQSEDLQVAPVSDQNKSYTQLADSSDWKQLSLVCERRLAETQDADREAKIWWLKSQFATSAIPVVILAPSLDSLAKDLILNPSLVSARAHKECLALTLAFADELITKDEFELSLSLLAFGSISKGDHLGQLSASLAALEQKIIKNNGKLPAEFKADIDHIRQKTGIQPLETIKSYEAPVSTVPPRTQVPAPADRKVSYWLGGSAVCLILLLNFYFFHGTYRKFFALFSSSDTQSFLPVLRPAVADAEAELLPPEPLRMAGLNHLDAVFYDISEKRQAADSQPSLSKATVQPAPDAGAIALPVAKLPNRSRQELESIGQGVPAVKETVNTTYPVYPGDRQRQDSGQAEMPEIDFPPFRSNSRTGNTAQKAASGTPNYVVIARTKVMKEPSYWAFSDSVLLEGDKILVEAELGKWLQIKAKNGDVGYILAQDANRLY